MSNNIYKKKILVFLIISLFAITSFLPIINGKIKLNDYNFEKDIQRSTEKNEIKKWTWLFYNDLDYDPVTPLGYDRMEEFTKEAFSAENLHVIALEDRFDGPANLWYIDEQHNKEPLMELGEVNMSNYLTLRDFIIYGKENYPAERYLLSIGDHGGGWKGSVIDETNNSSFMSMDGFQKALKEAGGVDVICFTPCSMAAIESAYELRNYTKVYVGNQDSGGYSYWRFMTGDLCTVLNKNPDISNIELGKKIVKLIKRNFLKIFLSEYPDIPKEKKKGLLNLLWVLTSISAIDTSKLDKLSKSVDQLAKDLISILDNKFNYLKIKLIQNLTESFPPKSFKRKDKDREIFTYDIFDFSKKCSTFFYFNKTIRSNAIEVMKNVNEAVIEVFHTVFFHPRAHGLTIYLPPDMNIYDVNYTTSDLDFIHDTNWDEFLIKYLNYNQN